MESVFHAAPSGKVHVVYDLKGSWIDRNSGVKAAHGGTLKDMDMHKPLCVSRPYVPTRLTQCTHSPLHAMHSSHAHSCVPPPNMAGTPKRSLRS